MQKINKIQILLSGELLQKSVSKCIYGKIQSFLQHWVMVLQLQDAKHCLLCLETQNHSRSVLKKNITRPLLINFIHPSKVQARV